MRQLATSNAAGPPCAYHPVYPKEDVGVVSKVTRENFKVPAVKRAADGIAEFTNLIIEYPEPGRPSSTFTRSIRTGSDTVTIRIRNNGCRGG